MKLYGFFILLIICSQVQAQNVGIGTASPTEKLEVNGKLKSTGAILTSGGQQFDYLVKNNAAGEVGFKKATGGVGVNYIISLSGSWPSPNSTSTAPYLGEVKLFAGSFAPNGWAICNGQLMPISQNPALFSLLGTSYGGDGQTTFAVPDLRGSAAIGIGTSAGGYSWTRGEKTN